MKYDTWFSLDSNFSFFHLHCHILCCVSKLHVNLFHWVQNVTENLKTKTNLQRQECYLTHHWHFFIAKLTFVFAFSPPKLSLSN